MYTYTYNKIEKVEVLGTLSQKCLILYHKNGEEVVGIRSNFQIFKELDKAKNYFRGLITS